MQGGDGHSEKLQYQFAKGAHAADREGKELVFGVLFNHFAGEVAMAHPVVEKLVHGKSGWGGG